MKKSLLIILILFMLIIPINVFATGSIKPSASSLKITTGKTGMFNITASNAAGRVDITVKDTSIAKVTTQSSIFLDESKTTVSVKGVKAGTTTVIVKITDGATYDEEDLTGKSYTITVTVTDPTTTTKKSTTTKSTTKATSKSTVSGQTQQTTTKSTTQTPVTTTSTGTTKKGGKTTLPARINEYVTLKSLKVVGYDIKFNPVILEYDVDVGDNVTDLYISANKFSNDVKVTNTGVVNIIDKDKVELEVTYGDAKYSKVYTINLHRVNACGNPDDIIISPETDEPEEEESSLNATLKIVGLSLLCIILTIMVFAANIRLERL